jgi:symplekin
LIEVIQILFEDNRAVVKQDVMAAVLQQLCDITPLPMLFMRTVIQTVARIKTMGNFVIGILSRLIMKQIWNDSRLWEGFVTCLKIMMPQSITVLLQLPAAQFEQVLKKNADIRDKLLAAQSKGLVMIPKTLHQILASVTPPPAPAPAPAPVAPIDGDAPYDPEQEDTNGATASVQPVSV